MNALRMVVAAVSLATGATASAQVGLTLAARVGAAIPYGDAFRTATGSTVALAGSTTASIPIQLDVGVTIARQYFVGAYGQYRFSLLKADVCPAGISCSESGLRTGVEVMYAFGTSSTGAGAWIGLGSGLEWSMSRGTLTGTSSTVTLAGWEFAVLQAGVDIWMTHVTRFGMYVSGSLGEFSRAAVSGGDESVSIASKTLHGWFEIGLKSTFDL